MQMCCHHRDSNPGPINLESDALTTRQTWPASLKVDLYGFMFQGVPYADAMNKTLVFAIFDFDRFSKHDQIGEVKVPLCQVDLAQTIEEWRVLQSVEGEGGQVRQSIFSLRYSILGSHQHVLHRRSRSLPSTPARKRKRKCLMQQTPKKTLAHNHQLRT